MHKQHNYKSAEKKKYKMLHRQLMTSAAKKIESFTKNYTESLISKYNFLILYV